MQLPRTERRDRPEQDADRTRGQVPDDPNQREDRDRPHADAETRTRDRADDLAASPAADGRPPGKAYGSLGAERSDAEESHGERVHAASSPTANTSWSRASPR
jgi:hypothetical protein